MINNNISPSLFTSLINPMLGPITAGWPRQLTSRLRQNPFSSSVIHERVGGGRRLSWRRRGAVAGLLVETRVFRRAEVVFSYEQTLICNGKCLCIWVVTFRSQIETWRNEVRESVKFLRLCHFKLIKLWLGGGECGDGGWVVCRLSWLHLSRALITPTH